MHIQKQEDVRCFAFMQMVLFLLFVSYIPYIGRHCCVLRQTTTRTAFSIRGWTEAKARAASDRQMSPKDE